MSSGHPSPHAAKTGGKGKRKAGGRDQHANQQEPSPTASATSGASDSGGPAQSGWLVPSPPEGGLAVGLPRATVYQIDTLDNHVWDLTENLDRIINRVENIATNLDDTKAGVEVFVSHIISTADEFHRLREVVHQLISSGAGPAPSRGGSFTPGAAFFSRSDDGNLPNAAVRTPYCYRGSSAAQ